MIRKPSILALAATGLFWAMPAALALVGPQEERDSRTDAQICSTEGHAPDLHGGLLPAVESGFVDNGSSYQVADLSDEEIARRQREFEARMPGAPSLNSTSTAPAVPQYEQRSATNVFPYSENATGLGPSGKLALYHVGVGNIGSDLISHPQSVGIPATVEYNIPHLPQEEPLWCWAAAAQQAIGWVNRGYAPTQCAIVALAHGIDVETCCGDREGICAKTGEIPAIGRLVSLFGGEAYELATVPRDPKQIYNIVSKGQTLLIRLRPAPNDAAAGIRHMIVVRGIEWTPLPNRRLGANLLYNDPLGSGIRSVNFQEIVGFFEQALVVRRNK